MVALILASCDSSGASFSSESSSVSTSSEGTSVITSTTTSSVPTELKDSRVIIHDVPSDVDEYPEAEMYIGTEKVELYNVKANNAQIWDGLAPSRVNNGAAIIQLEGKATITIKTNYALFPIYTKVRPLEYGIVPTFDIENNSFSFDAIVDGSEITRSKPAPDVFLLAARKLGIDPYSCIVIEDAEAGIEAAKAGGFRAAGIGYAATDRRADIKLGHLRELAPHLF